MIKKQCEVCHCVADINDHRWAGAEKVRIVNWMTRGTWMDLCGECVERMRTAVARAVAESLRAARGGA